MQRDIVQPGNNSFQVTPNDEGREKQLIQTKRGSLKRLYKKIQKKSLKILFDPKFQTFSKCFALVLLIVGFMIIAFSNQDCPYDAEQYCAEYINLFIAKYLKYYIFISLLYSFLIFGVLIYEDFDKKISVISLIFLVYVSFFYDNHVSLVHYGGVITKLIFLLSISWMMLFSFFLIMRKIYQINQVFSIILLASIIYFVHQQFRHSCEGWSQGLFGKKIDYSDDHCKIVLPEYCPISIFQKIINIPLFFDCQNTYSGKQQYFEYMKHLEKEQRFVAFSNTPYLTQRERVCQQLDYSQLQYAIFRHSKNVQSLEQGFDQGHQILLDLEEMKYHIRVQRNTSLINQRSMNIQHKNPMSQQIIVFFIDALSRASFHRTLPKTSEFLENRQRKQQGYNIEFMRMYSLKPFTFPNFFSFKYEYYAIHGKNFQFCQYDQFPCANPYDKIHILPLDNMSQEQKFADSNYLDFSKYDEECVKKHEIFDDRKYYELVKNEGNKFRKKFWNIFKDYQDAGFVIGRSSGMCISNSAAILDITTSYFYDSPPDHEGLAFSCDPNFEDPQFSYGILEGPYSVLPRCLNGKNIYQYMFEYGKQFEEQYREDKSFFIFQFMDGHEASGSLIKTLDQPIVEYLEYLEKNQLLEDTLILFMSDHGNHMNFLKTTFDTQQFFTERMLPNFIINFPYRFKRENQELVQNLQTNSQKLMTLANVHFFLQNWIKGLEYQYTNLSLFNPKMPSRNCLQVVPEFQQTLQAYTYQEICVCIDKDDDYINPIYLRNSETSVPQF